MLKNILPVCISCSLLKCQHSFNARIWNILPLVPFTLNYRDSTLPGTWLQQLNLLGSLAILVFNGSRLNFKTDKWIL